MGMRVRLGLGSAALLLGLATAGCGTPSPQPTTSATPLQPSGTPSPQPTTSATLLQPIGQVLVRADDRTLVTYGLAGCWGGPYLSAKEYTTRVVLTMSQSSLASNTTCVTMAGSELVQVTLSSPLGSRPLIDADTGKSVSQVVEAQLAEVTVLPSGFDLTRISPGAMDGGAPQDATRTYSITGGSGADLVESQATGASITGPDGWSIETNPVIDGRPATLWAASTGGHVIGRWLGWTTDGLVFALISEDASDYQSVLSESILVSVAQGIQPVSPPPSPWTTPLASSGASPDPSPSTP